MKRFHLGWILLGILSTVTFVSAQLATTSLHGTIKDPSGAVVPNAKVTIVDKGTGNSISAVSSASGFYEFPQIPPATYTITVSSAGFGDQSKVAELLVNQPATVDFALSVQASSVTVDVSASAQTLNTTDATLGNSADAELIQALPSETRNVPDLLSLQPGVLYLPNNADSRTGAVNGGRSDQGNVTIDGIDDNDQVNGYAFNGVLRETQDSIEEFRVTTGQANADLGRSSGAQISMLTKAGTNKYHGAAYWYYRPPLTAANNWFNKQAEENEGLANIPSKVLRNIFGADTGGPIKKDKLFFFGNYEGSRLAENANVIRNVATSTYAKGIIEYPDANSSAIKSLSPSQIAALDANCQVCSKAPYNNPPGVDPYALAYFDAMPTANGSLAGDVLNRGSYSFSSPNPIRLNTSIVRLDWTPNDRHRVFVRGNLQKDIIDDPENFPGQGPEDVIEDNSKGLTAGETWTISPTLINDVRYGYIRQGFGDVGQGKTDFNDFRFMSTTTSEYRSTITSVPVNNIVDNLSWTKGKHTFQFGGNWRLIHQNHYSNASSFSGASSNPFWLSGDAPGASATSDPGNYDINFSNLVGSLPSLTNNYNYHVDNASSGSLLADGAFLKRAFKANEFEGYVQDAWHATPKLIVTAGVRYTVLQTPWETNGQQVAPTIDTHAWYLQREIAAQNSQVYEPNLSFTPSGHFYNKPGFWPKSKDNFAPRLSFAYSPNGSTSIRAGAGIYYDHFGESLVNIFDREGSYGISSSITNPAGVYTVDGNSNHPAAPRFTSRTQLPQIGNSCAQANTQTYPYPAPSGPSCGFAITWGIDNRLKTPYSETFDFSVQHEMKGFTFEASYVGRLGRHLLQSLDLAEPVDFVDPQGGGDYFAAGSQLSRDVDLNHAKDEVNGNPNNPRVAPIPYFEHMFPYMKNLEYAGESATQGIYNYEWAPYRYNYGATTSLSDIDFYCVFYYGCPSSYQPRFWQNQFSSLYALSTIGMSYYNAGQVTLRHPMSHGLQFDFSYTYSKSLDMGSDAERSTEFTGGGSFSDIINTWKPGLNRAVSDFDTHHLITAEAVYRLPFGSGKMLLGGANRVLDALVGGWQLSGINRWSSGLPFTLSERGWTTDWQIESDSVVTSPVKMSRHFDSNGNPQFFANPDAITGGVTSGSPIRVPYPGEIGERNFFRGDGYFDVDTGLSKSWKFGEFGSLKFAWETYNTTNTVRFDPASIDGTLTDTGTLGIASNLLTAPRRMQFSLRYDF